MQTIEAWLEKLSTLPDMPHVHNLFSKRTPEGVIRFQNLQRYFEIVLQHDPELLLVGEAPGYQGTCRTGVPFCSEAILLGPQDKFGLFGGKANGFTRAMSGDKIWKEPSATIVQRSLSELSKPPLIWATFPLHPHKPGCDLSNRAPAPSEIAVGAIILCELIDTFPKLRVIAVGNIAEKCLAQLKIKNTKIRHPSHGGAKLFHDQLLALQ